MNLALLLLIIPQDVQVHVRDQGAPVGLDGVLVEARDSTSGMLLGSGTTRDGGNVLITFGLQHTLVNLRAVVPGRIPVEKSNNNVAESPIMLELESLQQRRVETSIRSDQSSPVFIKLPYRIIYWTDAWGRRWKTTYFYYAPQLPSASLCP